MNVLGKDFVIYSFLSVVNTPSTKPDQTKKFRLLLSPSKGLWYMSYDVYAYTTIKDIVYLFFFCVKIQGVVQQKCPDENCKCRDHFGVVT